MRLPGVLTTTMHVLDVGRLIDGTGSGAIQDARIRIDEAGYIDAVGPAESVSLPDESDQTAYPDATVVPGLIDAHLHLQGLRSMEPTDWVLESDGLGAARATMDLRKLLRSGFTSVRDLGSTTGIPLKRAVSAGDIPGPRIFTSGPSISQTGGHGDSHFLPLSWAEESGLGISTLADGPAECRKAARANIREGVDVIKIMTTGGVLSERDEPTQSQFTDAEVQAMVEEAHRVNIPVASHAQGTPGIVRALQNGVDTIEHAFFLDDEAIDLLLETDATLVPTLTIMHRIVEMGEEHGVPEHGVRKAEAAFEAHVESIRAAADAGVPMALGTDFLGPELVPHGENALEAELLVEKVGLSEEAAIEAGTRMAARTVPATDIGTLEPGNQADLVVLEADPLAHIGALRNVRTTYKSGKPVLSE